MANAVPTRPDHLPDFNDPPLREVAVGVHFEPLRGLRQAHFGRFWERVRAAFPNTEDREALPQHLEPLDDDALPQPAFQFVLSDSPPLHRAWFVSSDGVELIQLQTDRLIHNWRHGGGAYPHFEPLLGSFGQEYGHLAAVLEEIGLPQPVRTHAEVTYVNWIEAPSLDQLFGGYESVLAPVAGVGPSPDREQLALRYPVVIDDAPVGRLYVEAAPSVQVASSGPVRGYRLVLTFRAPSRGGTDLGADSTLLERGREAIVEVFAALTSEDLHERWGRIK